VPRFLRSAPSLNDLQVTAMADLARALEATMGWPVDIECAVHGDDLYLLQCRPITTLMTEQIPSALAALGVRAGAALTGR
jgi:phosphoenolpyruvate synthase/pyruvate phosphate dikinase